MTIFPDDPALIDIKYEMSNGIHRAPTPQVWVATAEILDEVGDPAHNVGHFDLVRLSAYDDGHDILDAMSEDLITVGRAVYDIKAQELNEDLMDEVTESGVLILDRVELDDAWRGSGWLGSLLTGEVIAQLSAGVSWVFTYPSPLGDARDDEAVRVKVNNVYHRLGFTEYRDGVFMVNLSYREFWLKLNELRRRAGLPPRDLT